MVAPLFDGTRAVWDEAGREGPPRLVAIAYFALGDPEQGRGNVWDYYSISGSDVGFLHHRGRHASQTGQGDRQGVR